MALLCAAEVAEITPDPRGLWRPEIRKPEYRDALNASSRAPGKERLFPLTADLVERGA